MAQFASWSMSTTLALSPGEVRMYRLPTMTAGVFHITLVSATVPLLNPHGQPGQPGRPGSPGRTEQPRPMLRTAPALRNIGGIVGTTGLVVAMPGDPGGGDTVPPLLVENVQVDLFHGDQLVASGINGLPLQSTPSDGDGTWRVRLQLAPESPAGVYRFVINLNPFPSMLPIRTRRIPLAFFQQGFNDNWNGRKYISLEFEQGTVLIHFDPELASYYKLTDVNHVVPNIPLVTLPNIMVRDVHLSIDSSDGGFGPLTGKLPYVLLSVSFTGINGNAISGSVVGFDINVHDFSINIKFFLTTVNNLVGDRLGSAVGYLSQVTSDFGSKIFDTNGQVAKQAREHFDDDVLKKVQDFLDQHAGQVGSALTPWLLGAGFDVWSVRYDAGNSQPVPPPPSPQGDIVIDYVSQQSAGSAAATAVFTEVNAPGTLTITTISVENGIVGQPYSQEFSAASGEAPLTWTLTGLPPGTTFTGSKLSGTPSESGVFNIQVTVRDADAKQASRLYTLAINPAGVSITPFSPLPDGVVGEPYAVVMAAQGGTAPYQWTASDLPAGLSISTTGIISGTPAGNGSTSTIIVRMTDAHGVAAAVPLSLSVKDALLFPDPLYTPRGDADTIWNPPTPRSQFGDGLAHSTTTTTPGDLNKVDHIVVVMMENRSFDHMLGYLSKEGGRSDVEGLKWENDSNRTQFNYYNGRYYYPQRLLDTQAFKTEALSPDHSHESVKAQMADGMRHFVSDYARSKVGDDPAALQLVMGYYTGQQLPIYDMLAREFAICDHWFCSHVGPTWPNRFVTLTGDLNRDSYGGPEVNTPLYTDFTPSEAPTLFDHLTERKVCWQYFQQRASVMRAFTKYTFDMVNVLEYSDPSKGFKAAVKAGLKSVTFVDPLFGDLPAGISSPQDNDDAPPSDLRDGQHFVSEIVNTLFSPRSNSNWTKTMLIIVYDEHGGFYDHVDPPTNAAPLLGQNSGKLGPRVPAFVVSPWTPAGLVLKDTFDHGTIAATILRRFCSPHPPVLSPRVTAALDLRGALPLTTMRMTPFLNSLATPVLVPSPPRVMMRRFKTPRAPDSFGSLLGGIALTVGSTPT